MNSLYWGVFIFVTLLSILLVLKILKGLFKLTVLSVSLVLVVSALMFSYSLVIDQSFTGMMTSGLNYTKDKISSFANDQKKELKDYVVFTAENLTKETINGVVNSINSEELFDVMVNSGEEKEKLIKEKGES